MHKYRTHTCGELTAANIGDTVKLSGWIHRKRDHGGVYFIDLRDHYGVTQLVTSDQDDRLFKLSESDYGKINKLSYEIMVECKIVCIIYC